MTRVLLAGESWISQSTHFKGFDSFTSVTFETGADAFIAAAAAEGIEVEQIYAHDVPAKFPRTVADLDKYDAVILSDIGANSFVLPPETWLHGHQADNPLEALVEWTEAGGGLMMAGGYLSFQGFQARANFARSPIAKVLPVDMLDCDDRVEVPQGGVPSIVDSGSPIVAGWSGTAPVLLGYNVVTAKPDANVVAKVNDDVLIATMEAGKGRSLVWTSDIGPHWCPTPFLEWDGFAPLVGGMLRWLAGSPA
ncbi:cytoplasmic protein [Epidermidibacterium keratini]|uniref:Cytoplasmic protein n=1 Tax=Epidermidibacterium keratini TaxID=1891644 RepID=A0A7L4YMP2_9ACTN|nr:glutamine amidotransferase [Epidermidibacterium keratini]QHC00416.1 cytoplasmic protein [Epidermidibacterium keratini]